MMKFVDRIFPKEWTAGTYFRLLIIGLITYEVAIALLPVGSLVAGGRTDYYKLPAALGEFLLIVHLYFLKVVIINFVAVGSFLLCWVFYFANQEDKRIRKHHKWAILQGFIGFVTASLYYFFYILAKGSRSGDILEFLLPAQLFGVTFGTCIGLFLEQVARFFQSGLFNWFAFVVASALTVMAMFWVIDAPWLLPYL